MPTARKPVDTDNLMVIIGQLFEATKAASEGLKAVGTEVQHNARAVITTIATLEHVEEKLRALDNIIHDGKNANNLLDVTRGHSEQITAINRSMIELNELIKEIRSSITVLSSQIGILDKDQVRHESTKTAIRNAAIILAWLTATLIALYAAVKEG